MRILSHIPWNSPKFRYIKYWTHSIHTTHHKKKLKQKETNLVEGIDDLLCENFTLKFFLESYKVDLFG